MTGANLSGRAGEIAGRLLEILQQLATLSDEEQALIHDVLVIARDQLALLGFREGEPVHDGERRAREGFVQMTLGRRAWACVQPQQAADFDRFVVAAMFPGGGQS